MLDLKNFGLKNCDSRGIFEVSKLLQAQFSIFQERQDSNFKNICELFEEQAAMHPNAPAVIFEDTRLTYKELSQKSTQLASYLQSNGVKSETIVGLSLRNHLNLIIGILGVLKAGGVYCPLDPNYPPERLRYMLEDTQLSLLLTESDLYHQFSEYPHKIIVIDNCQQIINSYNCQGYSSKICPNHAAYILYTSGSTGKPKGIVIEHKSLPDIVFARTSFFSKNPVSLLAGSISFDPSIVIILYTLICGGVLCLPRFELNVDINKFVDLLEKHSINFLLCIPSLYASLLEKSRKISSLKNVILVGEPISNLIPPLHAQLAPHAKLFNEYGPTEYGVGGTIAKIYDPVDKIIHKITIGNALPNTQVYILDSNLQPIANGEKGEIFIGGVGLARGYLNNPTLTLERFSWISLPGQPPKRLYRTGDFGRYLSDGNIEFLGRIDHQIKILGHRIELGEIEHAILQYKGIIEVAVIVHGDDVSNKRLICYFTTSIQKSIDQDLRVYLSSMLPKYMIPSAFVQMDNFSRTANGKIDRKALPDISELKITDNAMPTSGLAQDLQNIWRKVLKLKTIGLHDNFFDLGGDSLKAATIQTLIEEVLKLKISIVDFFQFPSIALLAQHFTNKEKNEPQVNEALSELKVIAKKRKSVFDRFKKRPIEKEMGNETR